MYSCYILCFLLLFFHSLLIHFVIIGYKWKWNQWFSKINLSQRIIKSKSVTISHKSKLKNKEIKHQNEKSIRVFIVRETSSPFWHRRRGFLSLIFLLQFVLVWLFFLIRIVIITVRTRIIAKLHFFIFELLHDIRLLIVPIFAVTNWVSSLSVNHFHLFKWCFSKESRRAFPNSFVYVFI